MRIAGSIYALKPQPKPSRGLGAPCHTLRGVAEEIDQASDDAPPLQPAQDVVDAAR